MRAYQTENLFYFENKRFNSDCFANFCHKPKAFILGIIVFTVTNLPIFVTKQT